MSEQNTEKKIVTACFTGHRSIEGSTAAKISEVLPKLLRTLINYGVKHFCVGGALGFDTMAAISIIELKKEFTHITLDLVLPCKSQTRFWNDHDRALYEHILSEADSVEYLHEAYTSACMHDRNRALVDRSEICVAYLAHSGGGTAYTVSYAEKKGVSVINVAEMLLSL